ncbi:Phosphatidylinositol 3- and 4-kinase family protein [Histomonas meleagridis]|uniref:Phosphatidylinositol 3- and 4-kinase family protein n=1 Tax=Histomonas meleagridis TaxID=135588 RepID=UPI00355A03B5|nr:Phosphatidylinositol 3- and 4-kinase family protein [Histomonas meleagridis]KAH0798218.1 Phosphatidylinositol 3- and 4-kinase family protein [Histomonas meleagridis]
MNPIQRLSSDLSESLESIPISEIFSKIKSMPPYSKDLTPFQENFIYNHLDQCLQDQEMYPMLFRTINWNDKDESTNIASQLATCEPVDTEYALEFLTKRYERKPIRDLAIRSLLNSSITELQLYIPQLVQAIKSDLSIDLSELLLNKSREDVIFATKLFWIVRIERNTNSTLHSLYQSLKELYHSEFKKQEKLIEDINELMVKSINTNNSTPETIRRKVIELLNSDQFKSLRELDNVRLPLNPKLIAVGIDPNSIKVFQSSRKPIRITFLLNDNTTYRVIFKLGDDMRQDQLIIQLFEVMDNILYKSAMSMPITAYNTLAFSTSYGCCECIENSMAIQDIKDGKSKFHSIREFLEEDGNDIDKKIEIFKKSCSVYCVMTYIVMVGDRHDNNILVANDGRLIHIDFGFIFGEDPKPFAPPLKLSDEMINTIGDDGFEQICNWAEPAFKSLREHARLILTLIELMNTCEPPLECFEKNNPMNILRKVEKSFLFDCNANEASQILKRKLRDSKNSTTMKVIDAFHTYAINKAAA